MLQGCFGRSATGGSNSLRPSITITITITIPITITITIAALLLKLAGSETTILEGALAFSTTPLGEMLRDGSVIDNATSLFILLVVINVALRFASDVRLQRTMDHSLRKKLGVDENSGGKESGDIDGEQ